MESGRSFAESSPHLTIEQPGFPSGQQPKNMVDLQNMLIDERMRCETHRTNYKTLKEEHKKLQDEYIKVQNDLTKLHSSGVQSAEHLQALVSDLQNQLIYKNTELENVRAQVFHPDKLEIIKAEISKELEDPLKAHMLTMDKEVEKYRSEFNKLRYEHTFLKAEFDHAKAEYQRNLEEQSLRHQAEVFSLQHEKENLEKMLKSSPDVDSQKLLNLQRQKMQLDQRVKNLLDELKEMQKQKEHQAGEADLVQRTQIKELSHLQTNIKQIESEKRSAEFQCDRLQKELRDHTAQNLRLNQQIQDLTRECASLRNISEEESHRHKVALTNQKLEFLETRGELERDKDSLVNKLQGLETELDVAKISIDQHNREIEEMERDFSLKLQETREEEWTKNNQMQNDKVQVEEKCRELEQRLLAEVQSRNTEREAFEEKLKNCEDTETAIRADLSELSIRLEHERENRKQLERDRDECMALKQKIVSLENELRAITSLKQQTNNEAERTRDALRLARIEAEKSRDEVLRTKNEAEKSQESNKLVWMEEKHRLRSKLDQVEHKLRQNQQEGRKSYKQQRKIKHALIEKVRNLRSKVELLEAEKEQLEIQLKTGRHGVSIEEYNKMRRRMREHRRRHNEFQRVICLSETLPHLSSTVNHDMTSLDLTNLTLKVEREKQNHEIQHLQQRLKEIQANVSDDKENCDVANEIHEKEYANEEFASTSSSL